MRQFVNHGYSRIAFVMDRETPGRPAGRIRAGHFNMRDIANQRCN
ncbi:hypothetical protein ALQ78_100306 [Pseudomonas syringae pv. aptata]|uniref:Uncharacterized protein n=2 Tax=Pseudomonas syringae group TaxID=136849 RepID=A0A3M4XSW5_9PSED|nr:hypothetical protein ALO39_100477 [Pseudomonas syringae pv. lapsa]KPY69699.1 hypothetical protein ALO45_100450 [Pseudomonas syringae pv. syringae]RMM25371.1 hypothetical protein ALQ81_100460 [Pseudomonas syringae pv. pisi]RMM48211.1 hypothetical protein ALQ78_100306 [Pseudomonas syringae pv. aptata]RMM60845.1 hypothetical protein ALQ76_100605 [Pseudomonas syringae pv. atrofaciens]RMR79598.1 hypothetical protein ALP78_100570 [Pseudomonas coronafaciens pv. striafaciens]RMS24076.1 hypothetica